jgi:hypothetical protein
MRVALMSLAALLGVLPAQASDTPALANNPFLRPRLAEQAPPASPASPPLELRAILSAGDASRVDVGGRIVGVGEEIDGYRLVSVTEACAVFEHAGQALRLALPPRAATSGDATQVAKETGDAD